MSHPSERRPRAAGWPTKTIVGDGEADMPAAELMPAAPPRTDGKLNEEELGAQAGQKPQRTKPTMPNKPIPTMGWPAIWYGIMRMFGQPHRVPDLCAKEKQLAEVTTSESARTRARLDAISLMRTRTVEAPRATVVFINAKGAAATTATTVWTATTMAEITRRNLIVLDANPASGTSAARLGMDVGHTITVQELSDNLEEMARSFARFISRVTPSRYSVRSISANSIIEDGRQLSAEQYEAALQVIRENCEYLFVDTANNIVDPATLEVVAAADVLVFTANVAVHDSLRQLATSMETLRRQGYRQLVDNAVVVISNLSEGAQASDYRKFLNRTNLSDEVITEYDFHGPFMGVPHDSFIARDGIVDLSAIQWPTQQAYRELAIVILEQAARNHPTADATSAD